MVLTCCATTAASGDGGNIEKLYVNFVDEPGRCPNETDWPRITKCPTKQDGEFCPSEQPEWSAFRCAQAALCRAPGYARLVAQRVCDCNGDSA